MHEINVVNTFVFIYYPVTFEPVNANEDKYNDKSRVQHSCIIQFNQNPSCFNQLKQLTHQTTKQNVIAVIIVIIIILIVNGPYSYLYKSVVASEIANIPTT